MLPHDLPPWSTVYKRFEAWRDAGTWDRLLEGLRRAVRMAAGRDPEPTAGAIDMPSVQTGGKRGAVSGKYALVFSLWFVANGFIGQ